ncbi:MAG: class I SAM-dependent methyltransferase [Oscillospiraceae bacterium]|jgi:2-polyprenyl-3-methyl-5-hydroxy-6-metoxy-1,4-benzoquinol methylase|nr:class I SAM-dependent methyltransferase [Oscillospiraceae bacterium]
MGNEAKFDSIAARYDTRERIAIAAVIADKIRAHVGEAADKTMMDYGCGTGLVGLSLLDVFKSVLFVDASEKMTAAVAAKSARSQTLCADIMTSDIPAADCIILVQVLLHEHDTRTLLSRLQSALTGGGHLLVVDFDLNERVSHPDVHNGFDKKLLRGMLTELGYSVSFAETFYHGKEMFMGQDASLFLLDAEKAKD